MQRIRINNIIENLKKTGQELKEEILDDKKIKLNGKNNFLKGKDFSNNWKPSGKKVKYFQDFIKGYIDEKEIKFCPYCGKNYLAYFEKENGSFISGFDIEHFFPKSNPKYKQLAKNFYNWHLACPICNQRLKKNKDPLSKTNKENKIFNPYFGFLYKKKNGEIIVEDKKFDDEITFYGNPKKIKQKNKKQIFQTQHGKFFELGKIYLNSQDTFNIFNFIQDKRTKIKNELNNFENLKLLNKKEREQEIKRKQKIEKYKNYFFKNYYPTQEQDILKFSNGKLKKDLIENLKI